MHVFLYHHCDCIYWQGLNLLTFHFPGETPAAALSHLTLSSWVQEMLFALILISLPEIRNQNLVSQLAKQIS